MKTPVPNKFGAGDIWFEMAMSYFIKTIFFISVNSLAVNR